MREFYFEELLNLFKKGLKAGSLLVFRFSFVVMEHSLPFIIKYDDGREEEIKDLQELAKLRDRIVKEATKDPEIAKAIE